MTAVNSERKSFPDVRFNLVKMGCNPSRLNTEKVVCHEHKFVYATVPKVASRSILVALRKQEFETDTERKSLAALFEEGIVDESYTVFSFVRNPWSRIRSTWTNKIETVDPDVQKQILNNYPGLETGMPFRDFLEYVRWAKGGGDIYGDRHWTSQHPQLELPEGLEDKVRLRIGRLESLDEDFGKIIEEIGLDPIPLATLNSRHGKSATKEAIDHAHSHREHFDDGMIEMVADRYARDIDIYGYSF